MRSTCLAIGTGRDTLLRTCLVADTTSLYTSLVHVVSEPLFANEWGTGRIICGMSSYRILLTFFLFASVGLPVHSEQGKTTAKRPGLTPRRAECAILLPERDERHDLARLVRADQFLDCERDGFPKHLAPPWKEQEEGEKKLSDACKYFIAKSVRDYPQVGQANLQLASDRCHINVMGVILQGLVEGLGSSPK
jgi:hypothetical protein